MLSKDAVRIATLLCVFALTIIARTANAAPSHDIVFVTQPPFAEDFATVNSTFGNQRASLDSAPRGGDLYIRYADGTLRNLTQAAGFGQTGQQGSASIAVRDPAVHWSGNKIIFSMVIGAPTKQYDYSNFFWQLYEVTNFGQGQTPVIAKVANQPANYNNVMPAYASDDRVLFVSDRPRNGDLALYPQRDEYESVATNTGIWALTTGNGALQLLDHSPSGDFNPTIDSFGRIIFSRWDHMQRDQQVGNATFNPFNYSSEAGNATATSSTDEVFPEPRLRSDPDLLPSQNPHTFNEFFPWSMNQDGTTMETINHVGRHELQSFIESSLNNDPSVIEYYEQYSRFNQNAINNILQIRESPTNPGVYYGIDMPEFGTHAAGQIIALNGAPNITADLMSVQYITSRGGASATDSPSADNLGLYRNPLPMSDGSLVAVHTSATGEDANIGTRNNPQSKYAFRLKTLRPNGNAMVPDQLLTPGITKTVSYWDPDFLVSYTNVTMWELQPVEVIARNRPGTSETALGAPEQQILSGLGISAASLQSYLKDNNLAMIVSRNVTTRDAADKQQPYNLQVEGSATKTVGNGGKVYPVKFMQMFQGDQVRGYGGVSNPQRGRRVLAEPMHDAPQNIPVSGGTDSVVLGDDGSMAAFVPAQRALTWHLTDSAGNSVVKERYWLTFQPGEIRVCTSCHGINEKDQAGHAAPANPPQALDTLLRHWQGLPVNPNPGVVNPIPTIPVPKSVLRPKISLKIAAVAVQRRSTVKSVKLKVTIAALNAKSVGAPITISTTIGSNACGVTQVVSARAKGRTITITIPPGRRNSALTIKAAYGATKLVSKRLAVKGNARSTHATASCPV